MKGERRREAGRRRREATMAKAVDDSTKKENGEKCRIFCYETMMCVLAGREKNVLNSLIGESWEEKSPALVVLRVGVPFKPQPTLVYNTGGGAATYHN